MCHGNNDNIELRDSIRMAGIRGLQGVIRKTVSDDLVENIWDRQHMEKIVPSLLFNMQVRNVVLEVRKAIRSAHCLHMCFPLGIPNNVIEFNGRNHSIVAARFSRVSVARACQPSLIHAHQISAETIADPSGSP